MIYKSFQDLQLSALGLGCMRLPVVDGDDGKIDQTRAEEMIDYAMAQGVNYYDTGWDYHGGNSEPVVGQALAKYPRSSYYLATKFPGYDLSNLDKVAEIFQAQLEKCRVDYFDFYLFHNVCEMNIDGYLDEKYGIFAYLMEQKKAGRIRHLGFSSHGSVEIMERFLAAYGEQMEFCQIQLNYLDWRFQDAAAKVDLLNHWQLPILVMEPLRGGRLAALRPEEAAPLRALRPQETDPAWAFRFVQGIPGLVTVLSGMSDFQQLQENIRIFDTEQPLTPAETATLLHMAEAMTEKTSVPCTGCHYCLSHCPQGLDIPQLLKLYNEHNFSGGGFLAPMALMAIAPERQPDACLNCQSCQAVCPQQIKIPAVLADFSQQLKKSGF